MTYDVYRYIFLGGAGLAALCLILSIVLFFVLRIPSVIGDLTGSTAKKAIESGLYETLQFPFNPASSEETIEIVKMCEEYDVGFLAMQPLCGGVIQNIPLALGFLHQYENVVPLWGVQTQEELEQILYFNDHPPVIDEQFNEDIENLRNFFN